MTNEITPKSPKKFICKFCDFECINKKDYNRHLNTRKHQIRINTNEITPKNPSTYMCECGKTYKHHSSLCNHRKKCNFKNEKKNEKNEKNENIESNEYKKMIMDLINENKEIRKTMDNMIPHMNNVTNINNDTTNNINNNNINLNIFLNEKCKDALNIMDFINSLQIQLKDLEVSGKLGTVEGTTKIFVEGLKELELCKRPIHCSNLTEETLYIKDNDVWEKDDHKDIIRKAIYSINAANIKQIPSWVAENKSSIEKDKSDYMDIINNVVHTDVDSDTEKIIKNIAKEVVIK